MNLDSVSSSAVRSVRQQDFLKVWFRTFNKTARLPSLASFEPSRIEDEKPELMYYDVTQNAGGDPRYRVSFAGARLVEAYGFNAVGRDLQDIISPSIWADLSPKVHPAMGGIPFSFEPVRLGDATGRVAEPSTQRSVPSCCIADAVSLA